MRITAQTICVDVNVYVVVGIDLEFDVEVDEDIKTLKFFLAESISPKTRFFN